LLERLNLCSEKELLKELKEITEWTYGQVELHHWIGVLNRCDTILERACHKEDESSWVLDCDLAGNKEV